MEKKVYKDTDPRLSPLTLHLFSLSYFTHRGNAYFGRTASLQQPYIRKPILCFLEPFYLYHVLPLIYGEGKLHATRRLKKEIAESISRIDLPKRQGQCR